MSRSNANQIISNPDFDVLEFIKHLDMHYDNDNIVRALFKDPTIVLAVIESGYGKFLEGCSRYLDKTTFEKMHTMGFEVWSKTQNNSMWYGMVIDENTCFHYRYLSSRYSNNAQEFEIVTKSENPKKTLVEAMRAKWKRLKMLEIGKPIAPKAKPRKVSKMIEVRTNFNEWLKKQGVLGSTSNNYYSYRNRPRRSNDPSYSFSVQIPPKNQTKQGAYMNKWNWPRVGVDFRLLADGPKRLKISVDARPEKFVDQSQKFVKTNTNSWCKDVTSTKQIDLDDPHLFVRIMEFATSETHDGIAWKNNSLSQLNQMVQNANAS